MVHSSDRLIIPFAKPAGLTSFTALGQLKRVLGTKKVGHTGTLDSFADGLLIALSGKLTRLVPYITACDKTYRVLFYFGKETDTLDPEGSVIAEKPLPLCADFLSAIKELTGHIEQIPPVYSAIKQGGKRLSDRMRQGERITVAARCVTIYSINIEEIFYARGSKADGAETGDTVQTEASGMCSGKQAARRVHGAVLCVRCSKGTYIRALVRDIAQRCASAAYVYALRRVAVGPFTLEKAAAASMLSPFGSSCTQQSCTPEKLACFLTEDTVRDTALPFDENLACTLNFQVVLLKDSFYAAFITGKPIKQSWFIDIPELTDNVPIAVFYKAHCIGLVRKNNTGFCYHAVFNSV